MHRIVAFLTGYRENRTRSTPHADNLVADATESRQKSPRVGRRGDCAPFGMARISVRRSTERTYVTISGRLTAADMGRLEHACGAALTRETAALDIDVSKVTAMDVTAAAVLRRFAERGARIDSPAATPGPHPFKSDGSGRPPAIP
jgi:ABC-type transporter Mla MlaB component